MIATLYRLWKQKELKVYRRWGDAEKEILYRQDSCLLPSDELLYLPNQEKKVTLSLVTWNINSIRARLELLESFLKTRERILSVYKKQRWLIINFQIGN